MIIDIWDMVCDVWHAIYDIWYTIYDIQYMINEKEYLIILIYDILLYMMHAIWCTTRLRSKVFSLVEILSKQRTIFA